MEPVKQQVGDGQDNFGQAAGKLAQAAKQASEAAASQTAHAAAATVQAGSGGAAAEVAAGSAAGPWGAVLAAAWAMRHTLFKVLVTMCLCLLFFIVLIVSLPTIVTNPVLGLDGNKPADDATLLSTYTELAEIVDQAVESGYDQALTQVEGIITGGGYDYRLSMDALANYAYSSAGYDVCYILAAYSASLEQKNTSKADLTAKLNNVVGFMFPVTQDGTGETEVEVEGEDDEEPTTETVEFVKCTIHPFDDSVIATAFGIDLDAEYGLFKITYKEAIEKMAAALKRTLYGSVANGQAVPLTDAELIAFVNRQNCSAMRKYILSTALSLVGKVPYFWGGKSAPGWNDEWNTPRLVTAAGSPTSGTIQPYGLDCSGFSDWVYKTAVGVSLYGTNWSQWDNSETVTAAELQPGDLGFLGGRADWTHVLVFAGYGEGGQRMWVHSSGGEGVIFNTPSYEGTLNLRRPKYVDFDAAPPNNVQQGMPIETIQVDVTHYCACSLCCGSNADGFTASGKRAARGMVAMSSYYPFGTQIMINGTMYTVEDRGGSGIENNRSRVDIFIPDHNEALRLGRYQTTAQIYRMGR
ncbi:NlpC/P60 family protein [Acutalibacter sp. JLR.KK004]|uniref:C40 family peptidase n=1 Tax=Acutalibacter sp. JLR.KK004 TaxID=3112622 RepID=UPI002FEFB7BA